MGLKRKGKKGKEQPVQKPFESTPSAAPEGNPSSQKHFQPRFCLNRGEAVAAVHVLAMLDGSGQIQIIIIINERLQSMPIHLPEVTIVATLTDLL